ncbi:MAG: hypothetical protein DIU74_011475 [Pseudomonadota bacterium]
MSFLGYNPYDNRRPPTAALRALAAEPLPVDEGIADTIRSGIVAHTLGIQVEEIRLPERAQGVA